VSPDDENGRRFLCILLSERAMAYNGSMNTVKRTSDRTARLFSVTGRIAWMLFLLSSVVFAACDAAPEAEEIKHTRDPEVPDVIAIATALTLPQTVATAEVTAGETEQPTPTNLPPETPAAATVTVTPTRATCANTYFFEPAPELCPLSEPLAGAAAEQPFEHGFMIWFEATDAIYVFDWDGRWQQFEDTFVEGQLEYDPAFVPPAGLYQPVRGFGKVWREQPDVRDQLGWALGRELAFDSAIQWQEEETVGAQVSFLLAFNGQVLALTNRGANGGDWVVAAS
jgi:hypothetical protein